MATVRTRRGTSLRGIRLAPAGSLKMKRIANPIALTILVSTPALANNTYTDQIFTQAIESMTVSDSDVTAGQQHISQGSPGTDDHYDGGNASSRSEEHKSELQSLMRISYAVFCLKTKKNK